MAILGDFNEQLQGGVQNRTGKWVGGLESKNAEKIMQILRLHNLSAANTYFKPWNDKEVHTFLHTAPKQGGTGQGDGDAENDFGEYIARRDIKAGK